MALQATPENLQGKPKIHFRKGDFDAAIWTYGYDIQIEKAVRCPCEGVDGNPQFDCNNCQGVGYFFINPIQTIGLMTGINKSTEQKDWSAEMIGTMSLSVRDDDTNIQEKVAFYDRVTLLKKRAGEATPHGFFSETLRIRESNEGNKFVFLTYTPFEIIDVFYYVSSNQPLQRITEYNIKEDNKYVLELPNLPEIQNGVISVRYKHYVEYHVIDLPHEIRFSTENGKGGRLETITLPTNAICRRAHLLNVERANYNGSGIIDNTYKE